MASALPATMDEDRVAAMSAALLSLGERAAEGLGRGALSQVYIEGEHGTVFLVAAEDEAVLVAVASRGAKAGMMLYEVRRAADAVAAALHQDDADRAAPVQPVVTTPPAAESSRGADIYADAVAARPAAAEPVAVGAVAAGPVAAGPVAATGQPEAPPSYSTPASDSPWSDHPADSLTTTTAEPPTWS
jgi:hypothetical protein